MEIVEIIPGARFPDAHELPNSTLRPSGKQVGHKSSGNGTKKPKNRPAIPGKLAVELAAEARKITEANRTVMIVINGKSRFVKQSQYSS